MPIYQNFNMKAGTARTLNITVYDEDGQNYLDLSQFDTIVWELRLSPTGEVLVTKLLDNGITIVNAPEGKLSITLDPEDTEDLDGIYYHNLAVIDGEFAHTVCAGGAFIYEHFDTIDPDYAGTLVDCFYVIEGNKIYIILDDKLENNSEYRVVLKDIKDTENQSTSDTFWFTSTYYPLYASFNTVIMDLNMYMSNINEDYVYRYIRENSRAIRAITPRTDVNWDNPPFEFFQYIRFKTIYDMVLNAYIKSTGGGGKKVRLGDLDVDKKSASADMATILKNLEEALQPWYDLCMGLTNRGRAKSKSFVKSRHRGTYEGPYPFPRKIE